MTTNIILHYSELAEYNDDAFIGIVKSVFGQTNQDFELTIISNKKSDDISAKIDAINLKSAKVNLLSVNDKKQSVQLNEALKGSDSKYQLYIDNRTQLIELKKSALDLYLLAAENNKNTGLVYSDYEVLENNTVKEIRLLKHHIGRVRDNQDYGKALFIKKEALEDVGYLSSEVKYNAIFDLRLKISENFELVHIANRYAGSLYQVVSQAKEHNVFDYLLASKDSQLEAEQVLSEHLKRINAYLEPGAHYTNRPQADSDAKLKASIIIPVNNRPIFISDAIESVQAQTIKEVEVIVVVNGGENDPTVKTVEKYLPGGEKYDASKPGVQLLIHDLNNLGLCFNAGAKIARGEYYVQLDSDDRLKPDAVEKILEVYNSDPKIGMVIGSYEVWEKDDKGNYSRMEELPVVKHEEWTEENGRNNLLRIGGAGAPRSIPIALIKEIGFSVNEEPFARNYGEDYQMVMKMSERHRIGRVWDAIYEVVRHAGGTDHSIDQNTIDRNDEAKDYMRKESILRRIELNR
ncbi:MAG: glycosyl transferase family 2 [Bacteroidetes bacterium 4572_117]|nr:MAG: glycosyl transferase family 2 [Bacteroidetes bacterium 4572_117]